MEEFTEIHEYYIGWIDEDGKPCFETASFVDVEYKYFEGMNIPRRRINGQMESFEDAYARVKRYYALSREQRSALANFC